MKKSFQLSAFSFQLLLVLISSLLLILSFPNFNFEFLAWIAIVPLFFAVEGQKPFKAFLSSYLAGFLFFLGTVYWLIHVTLPGMIIVVLYLALYFGFFGLVIASRASDKSFIVLAPAAWVAIELVRAHFLTGFGWALLGHSQSYTPAIIQIADITGSYGVSFLIVLVNTAIFLAIKNFKAKDLAVGYVMIASFLVFVSLSYGMYRLNNIFTGEKLRVAIIQGNIPQVKKWSPNYREEILNKYEALTNEAAEKRVDLIIWPETSVPGFLETEHELSDRIKALAVKTATPILVGAPREDEESKDAYYNSAILFSKGGMILGRYDKIHLVPFGEYVPFRRLLSFVENFAPSPIGDFAFGRNYTVFKFFIERNAREKEYTWRMLKNVKFSTLICFEDIFPDLTREFVKRGALFLVNMTNDAWFGDTAAPYQHAQASVFRALENRVNVVRATNTGLSCFIDQKGRIVDPVGRGGKNLFVDGFSIHEITLTPVRTFYTVYGDVFAYICVFASILLIIITKPQRQHLRHLRKEP